MSESERSDLDKLLFGVRRSIRYHRARVRFFDSNDDVNNLVNVLLSSAAIVAVVEMSAPEVAITLAAVVAVFSGVNLVVGFSRKARLYSSLADDFAALERAIVSTRKPTSSDLHEWTDRRLEIEQREPPSKMVLDMLAHNELCTAIGKEHGRYKVPWIRARLAQFVDLPFDPKKYQPAT